jgi:hypothetical protein
VRGVLLIERENSDGDRLIVEEIDIEGLAAGTDALAHAKERAKAWLEAPGVYAVRVLHDRGDTLQQLHYLRRALRIFPAASDVLTYAEED